MLGGNLDKEAQAAWARTLGGQVLHRMFLFRAGPYFSVHHPQNGAWIGNRVLDTADKLLGDPGERLASKMVETVRGTVNGTVIVAVAEGIIIGAAYVAAGVPSPLLFALLTIAFAMVPSGSLDGLYQCGAAARGSRRQRRCSNRRVLASAPS